MRSLEFIGSELEAGVTVSGRAQSIKLRPTAQAFSVEPLSSPIDMRVRMVSVRVIAGAARVTAFDVVIFDGDLVYSSEAFDPADIADIRLSNW